VKRLPLYVLAFATTLSATAATAQTFSYVLVPTISPGVTVTKVEMVRTDLTLTQVQATYIGDGQSAIDKSAATLKAFVGPSTSKPNPLLNLTPIVPTGGMVILAPVPGLQTVEVSMEVEQAPVRTAWKLPLLAETDFFPAGSTVYVLNLVKATDAASNLQLYNVETLAATCNLKVMRPKGSVIEERDGITVPAIGVTGIPDILSKVPAATAEGINVAVTCDKAFYALGAAVYQVYYASFEKRGQDALRGLAFFFGLLFITEVGLILVFGVDYRYVEAIYIGPTLHYGFVDLPLRMLVPCLVSLLLILLLQVYLTRTFMGRAIMAVAQDQLALRLMAIDPIRIKRIAFGISIATASLAGAFLIIIQPVEPSVGREYIGRVFAICVLGGLGSLPGAVIAAMLIGIVESLTSTFYGPSWAPAVSFGFLLLTLAVRPAGLLGR